jgi:hypothetical protein
LFLEPLTTDKPASKATSFILSTDNEDNQSFTFLGEVIKSKISMFVACGTSGKREKLEIINHSIKEKQKPVTINIIHHYQTPG